VKDVMTRERTRELVIQPRIQLILVVLVTIVALLAYIAGTLLGISVITPLLFYFPIILAAYWFPRQGVLFAVAVGILEVFFVYLFLSLSLPDITFAVTTASFYVLVAIAVVISSLSGGLKDREARYRGIFNSSEAGIFLVQDGDSKLVIEEVNVRGGALLGCHPVDLKGESFLKYWKDKDAMDSLMHSLRPEGSIPQMESVISMANGTNVPVLISGSSLPGRMMVLTVIDISSRKIQEEVIQARNQQISIINKVIAEASAARGIEEMVDGVLSNLVSYLNCEFGAVSLCDEGSSRVTTHIQKGDETLYQEIMDSGDESVTEWKRAISEGRCLAWKGAAGKGGHPTYAGIVVPLQSGNETLGSMYFLSCNGRGCSTDQRQTLESLAREIGTAVARLMLAQKIVETNQQANLYLDILMHDINNANLASLWYGDLLMEMLSGEPKDMARKMMEGIQKSREVIRNLETIRKIQVRKNELKAISLDMAIQKEIRLFPDARIEYAECRTDVLADDLLGEIFTNLIGNSLKFGGPGVRVTISASTVQPDTIEVLVSDTGPGIPDDLKNVIFRRFSQSDRQGSGKGLGLYIVKTLLERYGGAISVGDRIEGDHSQGAVFRMTFQKARP